MTNRKIYPVGIVVVDEDVLGLLVDTGVGRFFNPLSVACSGAAFYLSGTQVMLDENNNVRPAVLADEEKFRIHLAAYGVTK